MSHLLKMMVEFEKNIQLLRVVCMYMVSLVLPLTNSNSNDQPIVAPEDYSQHIERWMHTRAYRGGSHDGRQSTSQFVEKKPGELCGKVSRQDRQRGKGTRWQKWIIDV